MMQTTIDPSTFSSERDAALAGNDRFTSLLAQDQYLREIRWNCPLTEQEEAQYLARLLRGHAEQAHALPNQWILALARDARAQLVQAYLPLVVQLAYKWWARFQRHIDVLDLIQVGNLALLKTLDSPSLEGAENRLGRFLNTAVNHALMFFLTEERTIRIPRASLMRAQANDPNAFKAVLSPLSLESLWEQDEPTRERLAAPALILSPDDTTCPPEKVHLVALLLAELAPGERAVLQHRYGLGEDGRAYGQEETAQRLGMTYGAVKCREHAAIQSVRDLYTSYEQETGQTLALFTGNEHFIAYLEQRRLDRQRFGEHERTREINIRIHHAFEALEAQGGLITKSALAKKAGVSVDSAGRYLDQRGYDRATARVHQLERVVIRLQEQGRPPTTIAQLARAAGVSWEVAQWYVQHHGLSLQPQECDAVAAS